MLGCNKIQVIGLFVVVFQFISVVNAQSRYGKLLAPKTLYSTTSKSNSLYIGIDNHLKLGPQISNISDSLILKSNNGRIFFDSTYIVIPHRKGNLRIEVHTMSDDKTDTLGYLNFKTFPLPKPKIILGTTVLNDSAYVSIDKFLQSDSIAIILSEDIPNSKNWFLIREFSMGYNYGGYFIGENSNSSKITDEMKTLVLNKGAGRLFSVKLITQSATSLRHTNPIFRLYFY